MSKYTTEVRFICEHYAGLDESAGANGIDGVVAKSWDSIFNKNWEIFDENYRETLCSKILKHYYLREICCETVGIWRFWLNQKMSEIMPYYNQLYKSAALDYKPFYDTDYTRESARESTGTSAKSTDYTRSDNLKQTTRYSDTPQGGLEGIEGNAYLTNATITDDTGTQNNSGSDTTDTRDNDVYKETVSGKLSSGKSYSVLLQEYRETFLNIDMMVINELNELFFLLW